MSPSAISPIIACRTAIGHPSNQSANRPLGPTESWKIEGVSSWAGLRGERESGSARRKRAEADVITRRGDKRRSAGAHDWGWTPPRWGIEAAVGLVPPCLCLREKPATMSSVPNDLRPRGQVIEIEGVALDVLPCGQVVQRLDDPLDPGEPAP